MQELTCAIIGIGDSSPGKGGAHSIGYAHAAAYASVPGCRLSAACTIPQKNLDDFLQEYPKVNGYLDYREMLEKERPDVVSVCAYAGMREEMVLAAIHSGAKAVLAEKPFALTLDSARKVMRAAEAAGTRLFVHHQRRYGKPFEWFKEAAGKIGGVLDIRITLNEGIFLDFGPHLVDSCVYALGEGVKLRSVFGAADWSKDKVWHGIDVECAFQMQAEMDNGVLISAVVGDGMNTGGPILRMNGRDGFAELYLDKPEGAESVFFARYAGEGSIVNPATDEHFHHSDDGVLYIRRAIADIAGAVRTGAKTRIDVEEAFRSLEILLTAYESARRNKVMRVI